MPRRATLDAGLLLLHGLGQHARVEIEADRGHVPVLFGAEDVAGAADLEIRQRDLEAAVEIVRQQVANGANVIDICFDDGLIDGKQALMVSWYHDTEVAIGIR